MAFLKFEYDEKEFQGLNKLRDMFSDLRASTMGFVGHEGKLRLKKLLISSDLNFKSVDKDKIGRPIVSYSVGRNAAFVKISSYPLNLFENGRTLRSGRKEPGRKIISRQLKSLMESDMQGILNKFDNKILQKELNKI